MDRGALDAAIWLGISHGGWCPRGRRSEDGAIPEQYELTETEERDYSVRTERNVLDSDGTLILYEDALSGGTALTARLVNRHKRPHLLVDLNSEQGDPAARIYEWLNQEAIESLNVAGPRESSCEGIADRARQLLVQVVRLGEI